jgi:hypothetical protein
MVLLRRIFMDICNAIRRPTFEQIRERDPTTTNKVEVITGHHEDPRAIARHVRLLGSGSRRNIQSADQENGKKSASRLFNL